MPGPGAGTEQGLSLACLVAATLARASKRYVIVYWQVSSDESERLIKMEETLHQRVIGQEEAVVAISRAIRRARVGLKNPNRPIASFIFSGPTGLVFCCQPPVHFVVVTGRCDNEGDPVPFWQVSLLTLTIACKSSIHSAVVTRYHS